MGSAEARYEVIKEGQPCSEFPIRVIMTSEKSFALSHAEHQQTTHGE